MISSFAYLDSRLEHLFERLDPFVTMIKFVHEQYNMHECPTMNMNKYHTIRQLE